MDPELEFRQSYFGAHDVNHCTKGFSIFGVHQNHVEDLLKQILASTPRISDAVDLR